MLDPSADPAPRASPAPAPPSEAAELELGTLEATLPPLTAAKRADKPEPDAPLKTPADTEQGDM